MYGGRFGEAQKFGALLGFTFDRNNRSIEDVEPAWSVDGDRSFPVEWDQRDYLYGRTRGGGLGAFDYRFDNGSTLGLRGMYSAFRNYGTRYRFDAAGGGDDSLASGATGIATGATFVREVSHRKPDERMYGVSLNGTVADGAGRPVVRRRFRRNEPDLEELSDERLRVRRAGRRRRAVALRRVGREPTSLPIRESRRFDRGAQPHELHAHEVLAQRRYGPGAGRRRAPRCNVAIQPRHDAEHGPVRAQAATRDEVVRVERFLVRRDVAADVGQGPEQLQRSVVLHDDRVGLSHGPAAQLRRDRVVGEFESGRVQEHDEPRQEPARELRRRRDDHGRLRDAVVGLRRDARQRRACAPSSRTRATPDTWRRSRRAARPRSPRRPDRRTISIFFPACR